MSVALRIVAPSKRRKRLFQAERAYERHTVACPRCRALRYAPRRRICRKVLAKLERYQLA